MAEDVQNAKKRIMLQRSAALLLKTRKSHHWSAFLCSESNSEESSGRIVVGKLVLPTNCPKITVQGPLNTRYAVSLLLAKDTGTYKTLLNT